MHWTLSRTALICATRQFGPDSGRRRIAQAAGVTALLALPVSAILVGRAAEPAVEAASADARLANALAIAIGVAALGAGVMVGALAPTRALLGAQLEAAPVSPLAAFVGLTLLPTALAALPLAGSALLFSLAATAKGEAAVALTVAAVAAAAFGAAAVEVTLGLVRASSAAALRLVVLGLAWALAGAAGGQVALGPLAVFASGLDGRAGAFPLAGSAVALVTAVVLWALGSAGRPSPQPRERDVWLRMRVPHRPATALFAAMLVRLARNGQVRRHVGAGLMFAVCGAVLLRAVAASHELAAYFATTAALLAAAVVPLVAASLARDSKWLLRSAPVARRILAGSVTVAGIAFAAVVLGLIAAIPLPFARLDPAAYVSVASTAAVVFGSATLAGAVVPWRPDRVLDQLASYAALAGLAGATSLALGRAVPLAGVLGVSDVLFVLFATQGLLAVAVAAAVALER